MKMARKFYGKANNNLLLNYRSHDNNFLNSVSSSALASTSPPALALASTL